MRNTKTQKKKKQQKTICLILQSKVFYMQEHRVNEPMNENNSLPYKSSFGIGNIGSMSAWMIKIPYLIRAVSGLADGGNIKTRGKRQ